MLKSLLSGPISGIINAIGGIIGQFKLSPEEAAKVQQELLKAQQEFEEAMTQADLQFAQTQRDIIVAELQQDDKYTKRARPTVVYAGLLLLAINNMVLPWVAYFVGKATLPTVEFPPEFWVGWSGIVATWAIGRTVEKKAAIQSKEPDAITKLIIGKK